jgi:sugar phosphate isomerase/epimerase
MKQARSDNKTGLVKKANESGFDTVEIVYTSKPGEPNNDVVIKVSKVRKYFRRLFKFFGITITCKTTNTYHYSE